MIESSTGPKCPYCGHEHCEAESWSDVVTYWGSESGPVEFDCESCGLVFLVEEIVMRLWDSTAVVQSADKEDSRG